MKPRERFLCWLYRGCLRLYPRAFRDDFGAEMEADFFDALRETQTRGAWTILGWFGRELRAVMLGTLSERWKESRMMELTLRPVRLQDIALAMLPFAVVGLVIFANSQHYVLPEWIGIALLVLVAFGFVVGLARGVPEWCLPYAALLLVLANLFTFEIWNSLSHALYAARADQWLQIAVMQGSWWWNIMLLTPILLLLAYLIAPWRPFFQRVRADWTALAFLLYGALPVALVLTFDEFVGEEWFEAAALGAMMLGAIAYLDQTNHRRRVIALASGITIAMAFAALGKWILLPAQTWDGVTVGRVLDATYRYELASTLAMWVWLMLTILALPALLGRIIRRMSFVPAKPA